jgi:signal transduction histidine kinase/DNA-binding response OmpR family regulator
MNTRIVSVRIRHEHDIVAARQRARHIGAILGLDPTAQTRVATAVSELARNAFQYAGGGVVHYSVEGTASPQLLTVQVVDKGPGIDCLDQVLAGGYRSATGMGLGLVGTRRLMDGFDIASTPDGTTVRINKLLPARPKAWSAADVAAIAAQLEHKEPSGPIEEVQQQNQELLRTLEELEARQRDLERVNRELDDTNRGVLALYAELDERADHLRRADELKTRFLSNMTHEFRTPVNSILALTGLLSERFATAPEQKDEVYYIRKSAQQLSDIVDDLLDIAKVEAGKIEVRPAPFEIANLFGALRGMLKPLLVNSSLSLVFEEPDDLPPILSDENKVSQILRNFISNALKYTERGEVRVAARLRAGRDSVDFSVADTGIGIPEADIDHVFDEFVQIENPLQRRVKGTGLGLPLSKRLAELLGGTIRVTSELGVGSTFTVSIPAIYRDARERPAILVNGRVPVLVVEDSDEDILFYERALASTKFQVVPARSVAAAHAHLESIRPAAIVFDLRMHGHDAWDVVARLKRETDTRSIPLIIVSTLDDRRKGFALGADAYAVKPVNRDWLIETLESLTTSRASVRVLTVDDEETFRFIIREMLSGPEFEVIAAPSGRDGLRLSKEVGPDVILLDLRLTDMTGVDVCERLRDDPATAGTPILLVTSQSLTDEEAKRLGPAPILPKAQLTRDLLRSAIRSAIAR